MYIGLSNCSWFTAEVTKTISNNPNLMRLKLGDYHMEKYWKLRATKYDNMEWATKKSYLDVFIETACFKKDDIVLDVGTGTGIVAKAIAPIVKKVIAIDTSKEMISIAKEKVDALNVTFKNDDARNLKFEDNYFTKVTARMVFHHILTGREKAIKECYRVLQSPGLIVFSEGVPPNSECRPLYDKIFALKEKRVSFMPEEIRALLEHGGFVDVKMTTYWMRRVSTRKWLENSGLPKPLVQKILLMHINANENFKKAYNMTVTEDDAIVDWKFVIAVGLKV